METTLHLISRSQSYRNKYINYELLSSTDVVRSSTVQGDNLILRLEYTS